jgi:hypothetical protein
MLITDNLRTFNYRITKGTLQANREKQFEADSKQLIARSLYQFPLIHFEQTMAYMTDIPASVKNLMKELKFTASQYRSKVRELLGINHI